VVCLSACGGCERPAIGPRARFQPALKYRDRFFFFRICGGQRPSAHQPSCATRNLRAFSEVFGRVAYAVTRKREYYLSVLPRCPALAEMKLSQSVIPVLRHHVDTLVLFLLTPSALSSLPSSSTNPFSLILDGILSSLIFMTTMGIILWYLSPWKKIVSDMLYDNPQ
jgi:hypothetical protein